MKTETYPERWNQLPIDPRRQTPIPWFVHFEADGNPRYDIIGEGKFAEAVRFKRCWICGQRLGKYLAFVVGPMCVINRISAEPPTHFECGLAAARICPFLSHPKMKRPERELPENAVMSPEQHPRNPGVCAVYVTFKYKVIPGVANYLIEMGDFNDLHWFAEGRSALTSEIRAGLESGFELLYAEVTEKRGAPVAEQFSLQYGKLLIRLGFKS